MYNLGACDLSAVDRRVQGRLQVEQALTEYLFDMYIRCRLQNVQYHSQMPGV